MARPTYAAIALRAGVGSATVERVLNGRGGVRSATAEKVIRAARELEWPGRYPEQHRGIFRIEVILVRPETSFFARLSAAFRRIAATLDPAIQIQVTFLDETDPEPIAARIADRTVRRAGLVISAPDHSPIRDALTAAHRAGLPVVQVMNRIIPDAAFVGIDNYAAGRMAGLMVARLGAVRGSVAVLCHSPLYRVHRDRVRGFSDYMAAHGPEGLHFRFVTFGQDDRALGARRVGEVLRDWPDLAGLYNAGGGNVGVLDALGRAGRRVFFVGHELTEATETALRTGLADVLLDQRPEAQAHRATDLLLARAGFIEDRVENPPIRFTTLTAENL